MDCLVGKGRGAGLGRMLASVRITCKGTVSNEGAVGGLTGRVRSLSIRLRGV